MEKIECLTYLLLLYILLFIYVQITKCDTKCCHKIINKTNFPGSKSAEFCTGIGGGCSRPRLCNERSEESDDQILQPNDVYPNR